VIHQLIARGDTQAAINKLSEYSDQLGNDVFQQEVILLSAKYSTYKHAERSGGSSREELSRLSNNLNQQLLALVSYLEEDRIALKSNYLGPSGANHAPSVEPGDRRRLRVALIVAGLLLLSIVAYFVLRPDTNAATPPAEMATVDLTVFVHGVGDRKDLPLENQGKIYFYLNSETYSAAIQDGGVALFRAIPLGDNETIRLFLKANGYKIADSAERSVANTRNLFLPVQPIDIIAAKVVEEPVKEPISSSKPVSNKESSSRSTTPTNPKPTPVDDTPPPPPTPKMVTVRCLTSSVGNIKIWFYDQDGNKYETVSRAGQSDVSFKIPASLTGMAQTIHFKRMADGYEDRMDAMLSPGTPFRIPRSIRN
jgi:hypothetical protein